MKFTNRTLKTNLLLWAILFGMMACGSSSQPQLQAEPDEEFSGGATTVFINTDQAFSQFAANLSFAQQADFKIGNSFFEQDWVIAPASTTARDGLGPLFNANSCASCHGQDGRGQPPTMDLITFETTREPLSLLLRLSIEGETETGAPQPDPVYGTQFHPRANPGIDPEGSVLIHYEILAGSFEDGETYNLLKPHYELRDLAYGDFDSTLMVSPRIAPQMIGMGLLEAVDETEILAWADPEDANGDGISGKPNYVWSVVEEEFQLGRFGWKANTPSVAQQVAEAFKEDIGITSTIFPHEACTVYQSECEAAHSGGDPEIEDDILNKVIFYTQTLAVPGRRHWDDPQVLLGKEIFNEISCAQCHRPQMQTSQSYAIPQLAGQTIRPYTDLLLHDMGEGLADGRPDFAATGREWKTPPLWGIGLIERVNDHTRFLHDGRARNLTEAILWHGGEAAAARNQFKSLTQSEREALIAFLESL